MKYFISTQSAPDGKITQTVQCDSDISPWADPFGRALQGVCRRVYDTQEEQLREALTKLGWTPPFKERRKNPLVKTYQTSDDPRIRGLGRRKTDTRRNAFNINATGGI